MSKDTISLKDENNSKRGLFYYIRTDFWMYVLLILPITYFVIFKYVPLYGLAAAFQDYNIFKGVSGSEWVGIDVFKEVFAMRDFYKVLKNTLVLNVIDLIFGFPIPIILAVIINEIRMSAVKKITQSVVYFPHFISWTIVGAMVYQLLSKDSGIVNVVIKSLGGEQVAFLSDKVWWIFVYILVGIWQGAGWGTVIYLAAMTGINQELYEAAKVDGAGRFRRLWHITLPGIRPTIVLMLILSMGRLMSIGFERPYVIGNMTVYDVSDVISTFVYRYGLQSGNFSIGTAVGLFQSVINTMLVLAADWIAKKLGDDGLW